MNNLKKCGVGVFTVNPSPRNEIRWLFLFFILIGALLQLATIAADPINSTVKLTDNPREGWAVLMEMNYYPSGSDLDTGSIDTQRWNTTLHTLGWQTDHILIHRGTINQQIGEAGLQFLALNADANDVVLFFVFAHGNFLTTDVEWSSWFPQQWLNLRSQEKLFIVAACKSEQLLQPLYNDPTPHIHIASAEADEYAWAGIPEEELPILGEVFNHFFTNALVNGSADSNSDGDVTIEEAFEFASPLGRSYISSVVFPAFPSYAELCQYTAPHPVLDDSYPGNFSLQIQLGDPPIMPSGFPPELGILIGGVIIVTVVLVFAFFVRRKRLAVS